MTTTAKFAALAAAGAVAVGLAVWTWHPWGHEDPVAAQRQLAIPTFTAEATSGRTAFEAVCAACHGLNALGTDKGPPLIHDIYKPDHHPDVSFFAAARFGVRQHHWPYGNMPAQPQVSHEEVAAIVTYIRELQAANGIL